MVILKHVGDLPAIKQPLSASEIREYEDMRKTLRQSPGEWFLVEENTGSTRQTRYRKNLGSTFESAARFAGYNDKGQKRYDIYVRRMPFTSEGKTGLGSK